MSRKETKTILEVIVLGGVELRNVLSEIEYTAHGTGELQTYSYKNLDFDGGGLEALNNARILLETLSKLEDFTFAEHCLEDLIEVLEEQAADIAEELEIAFIYDRDGSTREYTPQAFWEASGSCEWEESAQYGSDYGWDV